MSRYIKIEINDCKHADIDIKVGELGAVELITLIGALEVVKAKLLEYVWCDLE